MKKQITIIGTGMGTSSITCGAMARIDKAELLIGAERLVAPYARMQKPAISEYRAEEIAAHIAKSDASSIAILVSGDVGFYSGARRLMEALREYEVELIPGISSLSYFCARLGVAWQDARPISLHGQDAGIVDCVRRNRHTFCLTGNNTAEICARLVKAGYGGLPVTIGENLDSGEEHITKTAVLEAASLHTAALTVLWIENECADARVRIGIPDEEFLRGDVPMTKSEVRAAVSSKLALRPGAVCYDIGAGTGSVTVEMALSAYEGKVYAIDRSEAALALVRENSRRFHIGNITCVHGEAPGALADLPAPDAAFIGGSGGNAEGIIQALLGKNPRVRMAATAAAIESIAAFLRAFEQCGVAGVEIAQLNVARARAAGSLHMLQANNPVFIISGGGHAR